MRENLCAALANIVLHTFSSTLLDFWIRYWSDYRVLLHVNNLVYSTIHKATGLMAHSRSMALTGTIPVERKNVHWP